MNQLLYTMSNETVNADSADVAGQLESLADEQGFSLIHPIYNEYLNVADDQHSGSLTLDYLTYFNDELDHYEIESNPEAEKVFARISLVELILKNAYMQAYQKKISPFCSKKTKYVAIDKVFIESVKRVLLQGCDPLKQYDCEHSRIVVEAFNDVFGACIEFDFNVSFKFPNDLVKIECQKGDVKTLIFADQVNQFVERLSELTQEQEFKYQQKKRKDRSRYQQKVAMACVDAILAKHSRIVITRLDFRYGKNQDPSLSQVKEDLRVFLRYLKRTQNLKVLGYIWKLEFAEKTGYHYHCFFFLDGRFHAQDIKLAQQIGEIWIKVIGQEGVYHNCNLDAHRGKYREVAIGTLKRDDHLKYQHLIMAIRYITKRDQFILHKRVIIDEDGERKRLGKSNYFIRVFGTSIDKNLAKNMGRPKTQLTQEGA
ncbi:inovirus-type Gp2 protein [Acinetobacter sp. HR7]|uniref:YagK/YfjJ domain-containing protein n=1 Tax=Acinetobacter sp. HR7 TaxID=1509403 RepID=UPI000536AF87|nr:inovirus-type Gp2 protein [Acinetobacter sp. HR7]KGT46398.1 hypothetical protein GW12_25570 [Acinetobacter sp. HR7]